MIKPNRRAVRITAAVLATTLTLGAVAPLAAIKPKPDSYTVYANDGYYSETTYYLTEEAYNEHAAENAPATTQTRSTRQAMSSSQTENDDEQFVIAAEKTVWVEEISDENGNVINSTLLSKNDLKEYFAEVESAENNSSPKIMPVVRKPITGEDIPEPVGNDSTEKYRLSINISILYDKAEKEYLVDSNARWSSDTLFDYAERCPEPYIRDYISLTWSGEERFYLSKMSTSGNYTNGKEVQISQCRYDETSGIFWDFNEQNKTFGGYAEKVNASVDLVKASTKKTTIRFTYIHTYEESNLLPSLHFNVGYDGKVYVEAGLEAALQTEDKLWAIEVFVPNI